MSERTRELLFLSVGDISCFFVALYLTLIARYWQVPEYAFLLAHLVPWLCLTGVWLFIFYCAGLYDKHTTVFKSVLVGKITHTQLVNVAVAAVAFVVIPFEIAPKTNLIIYLLVSVGLVCSWRLWLFPKLAPKTRQRALLLASGKEAVELADEVTNNNRYRYSFTRVIDDTTEVTAPNLIKLLPRLLASEQISIIVADPHNRHVKNLLPSFCDATIAPHAITFLDFNKVYEDTFNRVPLSALRYDWFVTHLIKRHSLWYDVTKRLLDITLSLLLGLLLLLLTPFVWLAKKVERQGDRLFIWQERRGQYNRPTRVLKFQTMRHNNATSSDWVFDDARAGNHVTRVGALLRALSLDELPQVWNVLKGDLSLIGPRSDIVGLGARLEAEIPHYNFRAVIRPGVSGWAQTNQHYQGTSVSPQSLEETRTRLAYDLYYIKNRSFWLDVTIVLRTIATLMGRVYRFVVDCVFARARKRQTAL